MAFKFLNVLVLNIADTDTVQSETWCDRRITHLGDRRITHLGDMDISFVLLNISSKFRLHLECCYSTVRDIPFFWTMINHCDRRITHLGDMDISFVPFNISSKFLLYLECYLLSPKMHKKVSK